jgi:hypothetical protein
MESDRLWAIGLLLLGDFFDLTDGFEFECHRLAFRRWWGGGGRFLMRRGCLHNGLFRRSRNPKVNENSEQNENRPPVFHLGSVLPNPPAGQSKRCFKLKQGLKLALSLHTYSLRFGPINREFPIV